MSNTRKIQPIQIWTANGQKEVNTLALNNFFDYHFDDGSGKVEYKLIYANDETGAIDYIVAIIEIPSSVVQQWGADDSIIWNYVANSLNLQLL